MQELHSGGTGGSLIISAIARYGDRPAIADGQIRWSYRELGEAIGRFITLFRSVGLRRGNALSILSGNRAESWAAIAAAMIMGLRYTPLHPLAAEDDHAFIIEDAEIDALIVESGKFAARGAAIRSRVPFAVLEATWRPRTATRYSSCDQPASRAWSASAANVSAITGVFISRARNVTSPARSRVKVVLIDNRQAGVSPFNGGRFCRQRL